MAKKKTASARTQKAATKKATKKAAPKKKAAAKKKVAKKKAASKKAATKKAEKKAAAKKPTLLSRVSSFFSGVFSAVKSKVTVAKDATVAYVSERLEERAAIEAEFAPIADVAKSPTIVIAYVGFVAGLVVKTIALIVAGHFLAATAVAALVVAAINPKRTYQVSLLGIVAIWQLDAKLYPVVRAVKKSQVAKWAIKKRSQLATRCRLAWDLAVSVTLAARDRVRSVWAKTKSTTATAYRTTLQGLAAHKTLCYATAPVLVLLIALPIIL